MACCCLTGAFAIIGVIAVLAFVIRMVSFISTNYLTSCNMKRKYGKAGSWAVVTGASEGIGHAMALDLGRRGFNVCVIARTQSKLDAVADELRALGVEGLAVSFDFGAATAKDWADLFAKLDKLEIAVLVNNVGINYDYTNYFIEESIDTDLRMIKVNCESTVRMTKYVLPHMQEKRCGAIVCLGSFSAMTPTAMLATYAGTKSFNISFGSSLYYELKQFGIDVLAVAPNMVVSKMTQGKSTRQPRESFLMVNAAKMAHQTLNKLGSVPRTAGHSNHSIIESVFLSLPLTFRSNKVLAMHKSVKRRAERKPKTDAAAPEKNTEL